MTRYAILGTGALGGFYGALLARAGCEVHFLARSDADQIARSGLRIDTPLGDFVLEPAQVYGSAADIPPVDIAIVAWKTTANSALRAVLSQVCGERTAVLVLQNGYDIEADSAAIVGPDQVLGGCCFLCCNKVGPGHIQHLDYGRIAFGEYGPTHRGRITERMQVLAADFSSAGIETQPDANLMAVRWRKLTWNIPFNGLSVVLDADTSQIMRDAATEGLARELMLDVQASAAASGFDVSDAHIEKMLADTRKMVPYDSSMRLDYRLGRPIEVEAIFGNPLRAAQAAGYSAPKIEMLYRQLCFLDRRNRAPSQ